MKKKRCLVPSKINLKKKLEFLQCNFSAIRESCNMWRNYWDVQDAWSSVRGILAYFQKHGSFVRKYAGPGGWNDPDMVKY